MTPNDPPVLPDATPEPADMLHTTPTPTPTPTFPRHRLPSLLRAPAHETSGPATGARVSGGSPARAALAQSASAWPGCSWRRCLSSGRCGLSSIPAAVHGTPHTALVEVHGEIGVGTEAGAEVLVAALKNAFADEGARAVVLRFNSPGGSPVQAGIVYDEILRLKALHKKPVYARGRGSLCLGRVLHRRRRRPHLCRQGLDGGLNRGVDRRLRVRWPDEQAGRRAPADHGRRAQGPAGPLQSP